MPDTAFQHPEQVLSNQHGKSNSMKNVTKVREAQNVLANPIYPNSCMSVRSL